MHVLLRLASLPAAAVLVLAVPTDTFTFQTQQPSGSGEHHQQPLTSGSHGQDWEQSGWADPRLNGGRMLDVSEQKHYTYITVSHSYRTTP